MVFKRDWPEERSILEPELYPFFYMLDELTILKSLLFKTNLILFLPLRVSAFTVATLASKLAYAELVTMCTSLG